MRNSAIAIFVTSMLLAGCASMVSPLDYPISVSSNVENAKVTIYNQNKEVDVVATPSIVMLSPRAGFNERAKYRFVFSKDGYIGDEVSLDARFNWWYVGNFISWGLIGVIVDQSTGAMWKLEETTVTGTLRPRSLHAYQIEMQQSDVAPTKVFQDGGSAHGNESVQGAQQGQAVQGNQLDKLPL